MTGRTHDLAAATALLAVVIVHPPDSLSVSTVVLGLLANQIGGIAPDIDQPTAPLWRNLPVGSVFGKMLGNLLGGHRFITHSLLGLALAGFLVHAALLAVNPLFAHLDIGYVWWAFMIGMLSHLLMDSLTKEGVPWLLPVPVRFGLPPIKRWRITTGRFIEAGIIFPALALSALWLASQHSALLLDIIHHRLT